MNATKRRSNEWTADCSKELQPNIAGEAGIMKQFENFRLDTSNQCLWHHSEQVSLPPKPFAVLRYLVENPGRLITHDELLDALWPETYVQPQVLRTYMLDLRKALSDDAANPRFIQTLPKRGYCFVASVIESAAPQPPATRTAAAPHPAIPDPHPSTIVDRDEELAALRAQFLLATGGQRRIAFITGEAGIGKTALVDAFSDSCCQHPDSAIIARGQCVEGFGGKEEYYPVMEALGHLCASADGERVCKVLLRMAPAWLALLGRGCDPNPTTTPVQQRMPGDLCAALEELSAEKTLILIFEDLHWADDSTIHLISALGRRRAAARLLILATYRPKDNATEHHLKGLKQDLLLRRLCAEIPLAPLSKKAVKELLIRELHQQALPPGLASFVHQRSEGNPLFVIAILEHLTAQKFLVRDKSPAPQWQQEIPFDEMESSVPEGLAQMIESEIDRLDPEEQRLLEAGSLINVAFPAWAVAAALEQDISDTEEACDALTRRLYFVQRAGQDELPDGTRSSFYVFAHELYREVLYQRQSAKRRARRHVRIADRLSTLFAEREASVAREMALHYEAANEWQRAMRALQTAAIHAHKRRADAEAAELLEHALRIADNLPEAERNAASREIHAQLTATRESAPKRKSTRQELSAKA